QLRDQERAHGRRAEHHRLARGQGQLRYAEDHPQEGRDAAVQPQGEVAALQRVPGPRSRDRGPFCLWDRIPILSWEAQGRFGNLPHEKAMTSARRYVILGGGGQLGRALAARIGGSALALGRADADVTQPWALRTALSRLRADVVF